MRRVAIDFPVGRRPGKWLRRFSAHMLVARMVEGSVSLACRSHRDTGSWHRARRGEALSAAGITIARAGRTRRFSSSVIGFRTGRIRLQPPRDRFPA